MFYKFPSIMQKKKEEKYEKEPVVGSPCGYWINRLAHHLQGLPSGMGGAGPTVPPSPPSPCWCGGLLSPGPARFTPICGRSAHDTLISTDFKLSALSLWAARARDGWGSNTKS